MPSKPYGSICALSKACEVIEPRWTLLILNQMWTGYSRFSDLRRAVGNISPGVLSKRLVELEHLGLIERIEDRAKGTVSYVRTPAAIELEAAMDALSVWAQRNIDAEVALADTNLSQLMGYIGQHLVRESLPQRRVVIRFHFSDEPGPYKTWFFVVDPGVPCDVCVSMPGLDVDLYVETSKMSLNGVGCGRSTISREIEAGRMFVTGDPLLKRSMADWLPRSYYATVEGIRMLPAAE
ncbi:MAG TPA: helix-turn-helix domain-containing protein [Tabrizicola sp.]|nr:helix-turn-helix transcriptional regulator [Tabrizicola sp.]HMS93690.1 helix-turn-helix domain-containing protein [Tabrizicola sp.]